MSLTNFGQNRCIDGQFGDGCKIRPEPTPLFRRPNLALETSECIAAQNRFDPPLGCCKVCLQLRIGLTEVGLIMEEYLGSLERLVAKWTFTLRDWGATSRNEPHACGSDCGDPTVSARAHARGMSRGKQPCPSK